MKMRDALPKTFSIFDEIEKSPMFHEHDWGLIDNAIRLALCEAVSTRTRFVVARNGKLPTAAAIHGVKWRDKNRHKVAAHQAVQNARLAPLTCEHCGEANTEAHHENYNRPLDVQWLCKSCHTKLHRAA